MASEQFLRKLYIPRCALCTCDTITQDRFLVQLSCLHVFCTSCVAETQHPDYRFYCPFDNSESFQWSYDQELGNQLQLMTQYPIVTYDYVVGTEIPYFRSKVNYSGVLCRDVNCPQIYGNVQCPYAHENYLSQYHCPLREGCWRINLCPYAHSLPSSSPSPNTVAWFYATVAVESAGQKGEFVIRSQSVLQFLTDNSAYELQNLMVRSLGAVLDYRMKKNVAEFRRGIKWMYKKSNGEVTEFDTYQAMILENARTNNYAYVQLDIDSTVYFRVMAKFDRADNCELVARLEEVEESADAGKIEVICEQEKANKVVEELKLIEREQLIGFHVAADCLVQACQQFGVATRHGRIFGTQAALDKTTQYLHANQVQLFTPLERFPIPSNFSHDTVATVAESYGLLLTADSIIGSPAVVMAFTNQLHSNHMSVPYPPDVAPALIGQVCGELGVSFANGYISGPIALVNQAVTRLTVQEALIPADADPACLQTLPKHAQVSVKGNYLRGTRENVELALGIIRRKEERIVYPSRLPKATVEKVSKKFNVRVEGGEIVGEQRNIFQALSELNKIEVPAVSAFKYHRLPDWYNTQTVEMRLENVSEKTPEFMDVVRQFIQTKKGVRITKVERIQNRRLYTNFAYKHESYSTLEAKSLQIIKLFHGTSATDPQIIFESDLGLDSRLGVGMWGHGTYYAANASYSHDYAHSTGSGSNQMFLCLVMVGDYIDLPADQSLVRPPLKKGNKKSYHSVKGNTGGSDIWITYEAAMSYPLYLITYS